MIHRTKPFRGKEITEIYRNCTYIKLTNRKNADHNGVVAEELVLLLTSQYSEKQFTTGLFSDSPFCVDLPWAIESINTFMDTVGQSEDHYSATFHTLFCTLDEYERQCREHEESAINDSRDLFLSLQSKSNHPDFDAYPSEGEINIDSPDLIKRRSGTISEHSEVEEDPSYYIEDNKVRVIRDEGEYVEHCHMNLPEAVLFSNPTLYVQSSFP